MSGHTSLLWLASLLRLHAGGLGGGAGSLGRSSGQEASQLHLPLQANQRTRVQKLALPR